MFLKFSKALDIPEASIKRLVHKLRLRYRALLREEVGRTVEKTDEIDDELRYLCAALTAAE
jgi:RNA polymerase sigma-70 factor (ECF subfamily)